MMPQSVKEIIIWALIDRQMATRPVMRHGPYVPVLRFAAFHEHGPQMQTLCFVAALHVIAKMKHVRRV